MKRLLKVLICTLIVSAAAATAAGCAQISDEGILVPVLPSHGGASMPEGNGSGSQKGEDIPTPEAPDSTPPSGTENTGNSGNGENTEKPPEIKTYYVIFKEGNFEYRTSYTDGDMSVIEPDVPEKDGYTPVGWKSYTLTYGEDVYVEAEYELTKYRIVFTAENEEFSFTYTYFDKSVKQPAVPPKKGYTNGRWASYTLTYGADITVLAEYDIVYYHITFVADGFEKTVTYTIENKDFTEPAVPDKKGYKDGRWQSYEQNCEGDITVYAEYTPLPATPDNMFEWEPNDGGYTITKYLGADDEVIIPSTYNDLPVTEIGERAFKDSNISAVLTRENMRIIGKEAFYLCENLTSLTLNEGLKIIGVAAFAYSGITELEIPSTLTDIERQAFYVTKITALTIPDSVQTLGSSAFAGCAELTAITIGNGLNEIAKNTFDKCVKLETVVIGKNVTKICQKAFSGCTALKTAVFADTANWYLCNPDTSQSVNITDDIKNSGRAAELITNVSFEFYKITE